MLEDRQSGEILFYLFKTLLNRIFCLNGVYFQHRLAEAVSFAKFGMKMY